VIKVTRNLHATQCACCGRWIRRRHRSVYASGEKWMGPFGLTVCRPCALGLKKVSSLGDLEKLRQQLTTVPWRETLAVIRRCSR